MLVAVILLWLVLTGAAGAEALIWKTIDGQPVDIAAVNGAISDCQLAMQRENLSGPIGCSTAAECSAQASERAARVQLVGRACMAARGYKLVPVK